MVMYSTSGARRKRKKKKKKKKEGGKKEEKEGGKKKYKKKEKKKEKKIYIYFVELFNSNFQECSLGYKKCKSFCRLHDNSSNAALIVCVFFLLRSLCSTYDPMNKNNFQQNALSNRHIKMFDVI